MFFGFDGGGTKCSGAVVNEEGVVVAEATGGSTNQNSVGWEAAEAAFRGVAAQLLEQLGSAVSADVRAVCLGMAGADREHDRMRWEEAARAALGIERTPAAAAVAVSVVNDAVTALASGTRGELLGVVVISGTGTIALGRGLDHQQTRCQGWGPLLGDMGSGYDVGLLILQRVMRAHDLMLPPTALSSLVLQQLNLKAPEELVAWAYAGAKEWQRYAALAPLAEKCAREGDEAAVWIIDTVVQGLWDAIQGVVRKTKLPEDGWTLVLSGGNLSREESLYMQKLKKLANDKWGSKVNVVLPSVSAAVAAALIALKGNEKKK